MKLFYLLTVFFFLTILTFAQDQQHLFKPLEKHESTLSSKNELRFDRQKTNPIYKSAQLIEVGAITDFLSGRYLTFNIPGKQRLYTAQVQEFEFDSFDNYIWRGELIDYEGRIVLFSEGGNVFGHLVVEGQEYSIQSIGEESVFLEYDMNIVLKQKCAINGIEENESLKNGIDGSEDGGENGTSSCTGIVRILVLYTWAAQQATNVQNIASTSIYQTNVGLGNSNVPYSDIHVSKAGVNFLDFTETQNIDFDVNRLRNNSTAQSLRNQYNADLVVLLTDANYPNEAGRVAEIGPNNSTSYAIVEVDFATANLTFAHEVAHLFGARHDIDDNGTYQHGYIFSKGSWFWKKRYRTIMGVGSSAPRIQHYSNPDVSYNGKSTGTHSSNDNARKLEEEGCTVENFRPYNLPPTVNILGPATGNSTSEYTWTANGSGGQPPYTYQWYFSMTGTNYYYQGSGSTVTAQLPLGFDLYIKLILTDSNQDQDTEYQYVFNRDAIGGGHDGKKPTVTDKKESIATKVEAYKLIKSINPNPANSYTNITLDQEIVGTVQISVTDLFGRIRSLQTINVEKGISRIKLDTETFESGVYIVKVAGNNKFETIRLIINK